MTSIMQALCKQQRWGGGGELAWSSSKKVTTPVIADSPDTSDETDFSGLSDAWVWNLKNTHLPAARLQLIVLLQCTLLQTCVQKARFWFLLDLALFLTRHGLLPSSSGLCT